MGIRGSTMRNVGLLCFYDCEGFGYMKSSKVLSSYRDNEGQVCELVVRYDGGGGELIERYKRSSFNGRGACDWIGVTKARIGALFSKRVNWSEGHNYHFGKG